MIISRSLSGHSGLLSVSPSSWVELLLGSVGIGSGGGRIGGRLRLGLAASDLGRCLVLSYLAESLPILAMVSCY